jgi:hypothetical protein
VNEQTNGAYRNRNGSIQGLGQAWIVKLFGSHLRETRSRVETTMDFHTHVLKPTRSGVASIRSRKRAALLQRSIY